MSITHRYNDNSEIPMETAEEARVILSPSVDNFDRLDQGFSCAGLLTF